MLFGATRTASSIEALLPPDMMYGMLAVRRGLRQHAPRRRAGRGRRRRSVRCRTGSNRCGRIQSPTGRAWTHRPDSAAIVGACERRPRLRARPPLVLDPALDIIEDDLWQFALCHPVQVFDVDGLIEVHLLTSGGMAFWLIIAPVKRNPRMLTTPAGPGSPLWSGTMTCVLDDVTRPITRCAPVVAPQKIGAELVEARAADLPHDQIDLVDEDIGSPY